MRLKINASITEFPLYSRQETFFRLFKQAGIDGLEIVISFKNIWRLSYLMHLSKKYQLPINSLHQSIWSGFGCGFDETFIQQARACGITYLTFHPLTFTSFGSRRMITYFSKLVSLQKKYDITIGIENMANEIFYKRLYENFNIDDHLEKIFLIAQEYGLSITYDTSHTMYSKPQEIEMFQKVFPKIKNIHLSSFYRNVQHLPLDQGNLDAKGFLTFLKKKQYTGLITFEINYSLFKRMILPYDFSEVERSLKIIRLLSGKNTL